MRQWRVKGIPVALAGVLTLVAGFLLVAFSATPANAGTLTEVRNFGSNPGNLRMFRYIPEGLPDNAPMVVALHGCTQTVAVYGRGSGWVKMADTHKFALVLPEQQWINNPMSCFNWFRPGDTSRGQGEALSIKQMVDHVKRSHAVDPGRVFLDGLSGGGAMSSSVLAAYPDVFAGGGVVVGVPANCAKAEWEAFTCMAGLNKTPRQWGNLVRSANPSYDGPWPKVSVWNAGRDVLVSPRNLTEIMEQWTNVHETDQTPDREETVKGYPRKVYENRSGEAVVETFMMEGQPHGQPLDPGGALDQCGTAGSPGMVDMHICAVHHVAAFFGLRDNPR